MCRVFSCVVGRGCWLWPVHSLGRTLLTFVLLHSVLQGQICLLLQVFLDFLLLHSTLFWVLVLKGLVGLHRIVQLQLLQRYRLGPRLGLLWYWMVCLGNELDCTWITPLQLLSPRTPFGLPWFLSSKEPTCQYRRKRFDPWVRKMPWKRIRQPTLVFSLGKCHGQRSLVATVYGVGQEEKKSWTRYSNYIADHPLSSYS